MQTSDITAVIPAYNAETTLVEVICNLRTSLPNLSIIVINDGSQDATGRKAKSMNIIYLEHSRNRGKGAALKTGFRKALSLGLSYILTVDADTQHNPKYVPAMLRKLKEENLDLLIGSRMSRIETMPFKRVVSNKITSRLISWRTKQEISDSQCGFRLIRTSVLESLTLKCQKYDLESELIIKAALKGYRIGFVEIDTIYAKNRVSYVKFVDILRFIRVYCSSFFWERSNLNGSVRDIGARRSLASSRKEECHSKAI